MKFLFLSAYLFLMIAVAYGQEVASYEKRAMKHFNAARKLYEEKETSKALEELDDAIRLDDRFTEAYLLKSDIYQDLDSVFLQIRNLEKAVSVSSRGTYGKIPLVLANAYYRIGIYDKARSAYLDYLEVVHDSLTGEKVKEQIKKCDFALAKMASPVKFHAENMGDAINTDFDEYWPALTIDGSTLVFTRLLPVGPAGSKNTHYQEDFYESKFSAGKWQMAQPLGLVNTMNNEGAESISASGNLIFFTACNRPGGYGSCDIYFTRKEGNHWTEPKNAGEPVNSGAWEAQPSIAANGKYLYFVSNRKGGKGGMDIWRCMLKGFTEDGIPRWGGPENLGDSINTPGNEMSPFIHPDGRTLYFSSDTWMGMGGTDIFCTRMLNDSTWHKPVNLGYPVNTWRNEQGLIVDATGTYAYYSSDRPGSKGMDIYRFALDKDYRPTPVSYVLGRVADRESKFPLKALVKLIDLDKDKIVSETYSDEKEGTFFICLPVGRNYAFNVSSQGYLFYSASFLLKELYKPDDPRHMDIFLDPVGKGRSVILYNLFFDTDSFRLLDSSKPELEEMVLFMNENPGVCVEIGGHTDSTGNRDYNQELSEKRAESVWRYLVEKGVGKERLTFVGYGILKPVATNNTPAGRAKNRRTEFTITEIREK